MNRLLSQSLFFYPATVLKGEPIPLFLAGYKARQWMKESELRDYQLRRLQKIIAYAYNNSDFYRRLFDEQGIDLCGLGSLADLQRFPTISKKDLIENLDTISVAKHRLMADSKTTGGSTGEPVKLFKNAFALARERCATARSYEWAGVRIGDPQLRFWGVPHSQLGSGKAALIDLVANRKRISAFDITDQTLREYYNLALEFGPRYIYGYVSVVEKFAAFIMENQLKPIPSVISVITTSEILSDGARATIGEAFGAKVFNEYGCGEVGSIAHECEDGSMHLMADNLLVEVDSASGGSGELIVTDLFNKATPLIRYRLGDYGTLASRPCTCGRSLPVIEKIHGRAYDIISLPAGRKVHPEAVIYVFEGIQSKLNAFKQFQVIQEARDRITVNIIPNHNWSENARTRLLDGLRRDISDQINFDIRLVESIEREPSGKMRLVKCRI